MVWEGRGGNAAPYPDSLLGGFLSPLALTSLFFAAQGALWHFFHYTLFLGINWKHKLNPWDAIHDLAYENPALATLGTAGLLDFLVAAVRRRRAPWLIPVGTALGTIAGIFLVPVPYTEYMLMPIVFLAIAEGALIVEITTLRMPAKQPTRVLYSACRLAIATLGCFVLGWVIVKLHPPVLLNSWEILAWVSALIAAVFALRFRLRHAALAIVLTMLLLYPLRQTPILSRVSNQAWRDRMAFVYAHSAPTDPIMDGWHEFSAPFRPHAWYYWFLPVDMRPLVSEAEYRDFAAKIATGEVAPKLVVMDRDNEALPAYLLEAIKNRYQPGPVSPIWIRRDNPGE